MDAMSFDTSRYRSRNKHMSGTGAKASHVLTHLFLTASQMRKLRHRERKSLAQGRTARKWPNFKDVHLYMCLGGYICVCELLLNTVKVPPWKEIGSHPIYFSPQETTCESNFFMIWGNVHCILLKKTSGEWLLKTYFQGKPVVFKTIWKMAANRFTWYLSD